MNSRETPTRSYSRTKAWPTSTISSPFRPPRRPTAPLPLCLSLSSPQWRLRLEFCRRMKLSGYQCVPRACTRVSVPLWDPYAAAGPHTANVDCCVSTQCVPVATAASSIGTGLGRTRPDSFRCAMNTDTDNHGSGKTVTR